MKTKKGKDKIRQEVLEWLHHHDCGGSDHSAIAKYYAYLTGIQLGR